MDKENRVNEDPIRTIEKLLDAYHKTSEFFVLYKDNQNQALYDTLRVYDGLAMLYELCGVSQGLLGLKDADQRTLEQVHSLQDALKIAIQWIYEECSSFDQLLSHHFDEKQGEIVSKMLLLYADPYATIVDGFISYSRHTCTGRIDDNRVIFDSIEKEQQAFIVDAGERLNRTNSSLEEAITHICGSSTYQNLAKSLIQSIHLENDELQYSISSDLHRLYCYAGELHWNETSSVPQEWVFDEFTLAEFKKCWIELYAKSQAHFLAKYYSGLPGMAQADAVIIKEKDQLVNELQGNTGTKTESVNAIIDILTYDPKLKNTDIMYQPLIKIGKQIIITPMLFLSSRPERNLLSIIQKKNDKHYSIEVNELEKKMCDDLRSSLPANVVYCAGKKIGKEYPDIDFAIYDHRSNAILISEMKWLIEADSTREVLERQKDIDHGCSQIEEIMGHAMADTLSFAKQVFNIDLNESPDLFWCVIAKHNIRSTNVHVPVISLNSLKQLLSCLPLNTVFNMIRNKEYYKSLPERSEMGHLKVQYAGYEVWVPALIIEKEYEVFEDEVL